MSKIPRPLPHPMLRRRNYFMGGMTPNPGGIPSPAPGPMPAFQPPSPGLRPLPQPRLTPNSVGLSASSGSRPRPNPLAGWVSPNAPLQSGTGGGPAPWANPNGPQTQAGNPGDVTGAAWANPGSGAIQQNGSANPAPWANPGMGVLTDTKGMSTGTGTPVPDGGPNFGQPGNGFWTNVLRQKFNNNRPMVRAFRQNYRANNMPIPLKGSPGTPPVATFRRGGVTRKPFVRGVGTSYAGGGTAKVVPGAPRLPAPDIIPAALKPDEVILNDKQKKGVMPVPGKEHLLLPEQLSALKKVRRTRMQGGGLSTPDAGQIARPKTNSDFDQIPINGKFIDPGDPTNPDGSPKVYIKHSHRSRTEQHQGQAMFQYPFA